MTEETKKIEKLTPEQEAKLDDYRDKWLAIGLSTEETDVELAEAAMDKVYECAGLPAPENKIWAKNPYEGAVLAAQLAKYGEIKEGNQLSKSEITNQLSQAGYGNHDASWISFYDFFQEEVGIDLHQVNGLIELAKHCGWWWPFDTTVVMTPKATHLAMDDQGRLHAENQAALSFADGWSIYAWHGVRVPERLIMDPKSYKANEILGEGNAEIRRCMMEKVGMNVFLSEAELLGKDEVGELYQLEISGDENLTFVKVINSTAEPDGSFKEYCLRVPPDTSSAKAGIAWGFGKEVDEYCPAIES
jgi:hypothetical protein